MLWTLVLVFFVTLSVFLLVIAGMAVGVMLGRREISGSCGGLGQQEGESSCSLCSNPDAACKELKEQMQGRTGQDCDSGECGDALCESAPGDTPVVCKE